MRHELAVDQRRERAEHLVGRERQVARPAAVADHRLPQRVEREPGLRQRLQDRVGIVPDRGRRTSARRARFAPGAGVALARARQRRP
jgi:hypothetical protein